MKSNELVGNSDEAHPKQLFERVPVIEVNCENLDVIWPQLLATIRKSQLVAIDLELSGLGNRVGSRSNFTERYKHLRQTTQSRSILSFGIATFQFDRIDDEQEKHLRYKCTVFDLLALEDKAFTVEPESLQFLSSHGFDFNRLISHGIRYSKKNTSRGPFHSLWEEILASGVCIALHNGLNDLAFIHEHFYAPLPENHDQFVANLADWFGERPEVDDYRAMDCALWDSKYMAERSDSRFSYSFLEYVFRKAQRDNHRLFVNGKPHIGIKFSKLKNIAINFQNCGIGETFLQGSLTDVKKEQLCENYSRFGRCRYPIGCTKEHEVDLLLDLEEKRAQQKREKDRKRRMKKNKAMEKVNGGEKEDEAESEKSSQENEEIDCPTKEIENGIGNEDQQQQRNGRKRKWAEIGEDDEQLEFLPNEASTSNLSPKNENPHVETQNSIALIENGLPFSNNRFSGNKAVQILTSARGCHRAGMDAFMTGFAVLFLQLDYVYQNAGCFDRRTSGRISLPGKEFPLLIRKANFVSQTEGQQLNWARIEGRRRAFDNAIYERSQHFPFDQKLFMLRA